MERGLVGNRMGGEYSSEDIPPGLTLMPDWSHLTAAVYRLNVAQLVAPQMAAVQAATMSLPLRERRALELRFGISDAHVRTVEEVAAILQMRFDEDRTVPESPPVESVGQVIALAILRLRHDLGLIPRR